MVKSWAACFCFLFVSLPSWVRGAALHGDAGMSSLECQGGRGGGVDVVVQWQGVPEAEGFGTMMMMVLILIDFSSGSDSGDDIM